MEKVAREVQSEPGRPSFPHRATRYEPSRNEARLSWRDSGFVNESARADPEPSTELAAPQLFALLLDISQTGAAIALDRVFRSGEGVWLRLEGQDSTNWTAAEVVGVTTTTRGPHLVRLAFRSPCPFETLRAAILG
jgi:hypothetical protein